MKTGFYQCATIAGLRHTLEAQLVSTGGRPRLKGTFMRQHKIPLDSATWAILKYIAKRLRSDTIKPTAGQLANLLVNGEIKKLVDAGRIDDQPRLKELYEKSRR